MDLMKMVTDLALPSHVSATHTNHCKATMPTVCMLAIIVFTLSSDGGYAFSQEDHGMTKKVPSQHGE